jgi:carbamoyltransferase
MKMKMNNNPNILGLSFDYHDAAAALISNGKVISAAMEERFSRIKHDSAFPRSAISFCIETAGITIEQVDAVVYYENPLLKFDRILRSAMKTLPESKTYFYETLSSWVAENKFDVKRKIQEELGCSLDKVHCVLHHQAHAASAFYCSPFDRSTIVTIDGVGEHETMTISLGEGKRIKKISSVSLPNSLGLFYSAFTAFLGFKVNSGEYKVMGMSGFGTPVYQDKFRALVNLLPDGGFEIDQQYFNFLCPEDLPYNENLIFLFGPPRPPETLFDIGDPRNPPADDFQRQNRYYADVAASLQLVTEEIISHLVNSAIKQTGVGDVVMAGGVALNSLANRIVKDTIPGELFIQPAAGDSGSAVGAALFYSHSICDHPRDRAMADVFLGKSYTNHEIQEVLTEHNIVSYRYIKSEVELLKLTVDKLAQGDVVGWYQGAFEWGPRALGNRSIIANPCIKDMQKKVNEKIKFREPFRPFAPSVLADKADRFFEIPVIEHAWDPEHFMLAIARVKADKTSVIPAVTHIDGTSRIQTVSRDVSPLYYDLISAFEKQTGIPLVLNTSFNLRGEPIVNTPWDALKTFYNSGLDYLVLGRFFIHKDKITCK